MAKADNYLYTRNNWLQSRMGYLDKEEASGRLAFVRRMFVLHKQGLPEAIAWAEAELATLEGAAADGFRDELGRFKLSVGAD